MFPKVTDVSFDKMQMCMLHRQTTLRWLWLKAKLTLSSLTSEPPFLSFNHLVYLTDYCYCNDNCELGAQETILLAVITISNYFK